MSAISGVFCDHQPTKAPSSNNTLYCQFRYPQGYTCTTLLRFGGGAATPSTPLAGTSTTSCGWRPGDHPYGEGQLEPHTVRERAPAESNRKWLPWMKVSD